MAALADDIAYDNHDIDDGLRAGFLDMDTLLGLDFVAEQWREVESRFPDAPAAARQRELVRGQIGMMVNDVIETSRPLLADARSAADVRQAGAPLVRFSAEMAERERRLKTFMYANLYHHAQQHGTAEKAQALVAQLFAAYEQDPALMGESWGTATPAEEPARSRHIADYIAGMTDRFAMDAYARIFGRQPEGLSNV